MSSVRDDSLSVHSFLHGIEHLSNIAVRGLVLDGKTEAEIQAEILPVVHSLRTVVQELYGTTANGVHVLALLFMAKLLFENSIQVVKASGDPSAN